MQFATHDLAAALGVDDERGARQALVQAGPEDRDAVLTALISHAGAGSTLATELLVGYLDDTGTVRRMVGAALLDASAVDDVSQDVLISVATSVGSFDGRSKVTTWVNSIVRHKVVDHLRRQRATAPLPDDDLSPAARMSSLIATRATVQQALAALPEPYRTPVVLRDLEGLPYAKVAERLDRNVGTVKAQISRGRAMVAARLRGTDEVTG